MYCTGKNLTIVIHDRSVNYNDEGPENAPVIIFIHGFPLNKSMWNGQAEALSVNYRVLAYDIRGQGDSDSGMEDFTIDLFARDLIGLMDTLKIKTALLCGLSMGGYIALHGVINYPNRFFALVLSDTQCTEDSPEAKEKRMQTIESIKENGVENYAELSIKNLFAPASFTAHIAETEFVREMILNTPKPSLIKTLAALAARNEYCSKLPEINLPVLILVGKEDKITPPEASLFMHKKIPKSTMYVLDHCGHLANIENRSAFNAQLKEFADSVSLKMPCPGDPEAH